MEKEGRSRFLTWLFGREDPSQVAGETAEIVSEEATVDDNTSAEEQAQSVGNDQLSEELSQQQDERLLLGNSEASLSEAPASALQRLAQRLRKTRQALGSQVLGLLGQRRLDRELLDSIEEQLLLADVGLPTTMLLIQSLEQTFKEGQLVDAKAWQSQLKSLLSSWLKPVEQPLTITASCPYVILMVGVNGVGKTTTIGKLAYQLQRSGKSVMLAAADTFRAAAVEQLQAWGERSQIPVIAQPTSTDAAAVAFDALQAAKARQIDVLIIDTAGRLHNKEHLMVSLQKMLRVLKKLDPQAPHEILLTVDATTGQNAISQVKLFHQAVGVTGIVLSKLEGTAKGGVLLALAKQFSIPIRYLGLGEQLDDLQPFVATEFIEALFMPEERSS